MRELSKLLQKRFDEMCKTGKLYRSSISGEKLWQVYLGAYQNPPIFRSTESNVHNCNYCHTFFRQYSNIIALDKDLGVMSIFDINPSDIPEEYRDAIITVSNYIHQEEKIGSIFVETCEYLLNPKTPFGNKKREQEKFNLGIESNVKLYNQIDVDRWPNSGIKVGDIITFTHIFLTIPRQLIYFGYSSKESIIADALGMYDIFKKGMEEIDIESYNSVLELEEQGSLLNGSTYIDTVKKARDYKIEYTKIAPEKKDLWLWQKSQEWGPACKFRNNVIGTLLLELTEEEKSMEECCKAFNMKVDPANYMKASAPITKKQIEAAQRFVDDNGYTTALQRRCATIEDIMVSDILHSNQDATETKTVISVFDTIKSSTPARKFDTSKVPEVGIEEFMKDILPGSKEIDLWLSVKHKDNFMTLLTSEDKNSKPLFKWSNNFSWTYNGNLTGKSQITTAVKNAGGFVDAPFRFSIMWNENQEATHCDLDAHCTCPTESGRNTDIYYGNKRPSGCSGQLDIDIVTPGKKVAVENIFWKDLSKIKPGQYKFYVINFNGGENQGFHAEIFLNGDLYTFRVPHTVKGTVEIATIQVKPDHSFEMGGNWKKYLVDQNTQVEEIYGLQSGDFHKVSLICLSPNHWCEKGVGNKHYFFMLSGAKAPDKIRSLHNEFLVQELYDHRKVMEVLGSQLKVESTEGQLSGLGFNATVRDEVILRIDNKRLIKVKF